MHAITDDNSNGISHRPKILDFIFQEIITSETLKLWDSRQKEYERGIVSLVPQKLLANCGYQTSKVNSLFEWNFWGANELDLLAQSMFGSTKTMITAFMATQLEEYSPKQKFLVLAAGWPRQFNEEYSLANLGDLEQLRMNIFFQVDQNI